MKNAIPMILLAFVFSALAWCADAKDRSPTEQADASVDVQTGRVTPVLLFLEPGDVRDVEGRLAYRANPIQFIQNLDRTRVGKQGLRAYLSIPAKDGSLCVYGERIGATFVAPEGKAYSWKIVRVKTRDGLTIETFEELYESPNEHPWLIEAALVRDGRTSELMFFKWARHDGNAHALWGFTSRDGRRWDYASHKPLHIDHDAFGIMSDPGQNRYLCYQVTYQPFAKKFPDNIGEKKRRVLSIRTSGDGENWSWIRDVGQNGLILPDQHDPDELEFYRMFAFPYGNRFIASVDLYAPSRILPYRHGPHFMCRWWLSRDAVHWKRPWRDVEAQGDCPYVIKMPPIWLAKRMLWWIGDGVYALPEYRIASIGSRANGAFTTKPFAMPSGPLLLNVEMTKRPGFFNQSYVMAELLDEHRRVLPGYEAKNCLLEKKKVDDTRLPLVWRDKEGHQRDGSEFAGNNVALRFYMRDARLYAVTTPAPGLLEDDSLS